MAKPSALSKCMEEAGASANQGEPTIFVQCMDLHCELREAIGLPPLPGWKRTRSTPEWVKNICVRYRRTILKSVLKLKPGRRVNWRNYGRCFGLMERYKVFFNQDVPRLLRKEGLLNLSTKQQAKLDAISGEREMREYYLKELNRPVADPITTEELVTMGCEQQLERLEKHRQVALFHLASQDFKTSSIFWKGVSEGFSMFLNEDGEFTGDDRRIEVYSELLSSQYQVEKMRRMLPAKSRTDLRMEMKRLSNFRDQGQGWFNDVCNDIKLSMKGAGRPHGVRPSKPASA